MRLKDIAYEIGITRQELRQELQKTNFGVALDAKEVPDALGWGIIRFLAPKFKDRKKEQDRKEDARKKAEEMEGDSASLAGEKIEVRKASHVSLSAPIAPNDDEENEEVQAIPSVKEETQEEVSVDLKQPMVFRTAAEFQKKKESFELKKKEEEVQRKARIASEIAQKAATKLKSAAASPTWKKSPAIHVTRKIEFSDVEKGEIEKKKKTGRKGSAPEVVNVVHTKSKRFKTTALTEDDLTPEQRVAILAEEEMQRKLEDEAFKLSQAKRRAKVQTREKLDTMLVKKEGTIEIPDVITVKEFSEKTGIGVGILVSTLVKNGIMATMNSSIDYETWALLSDDFDIVLKKEQTQHSVEDIMEGNLAKLVQDDKENLQHRPPVIVVMGHVDHGKTSILDYFRNTNVVSKESGGITQHIGAYQVEKKGKLITFLDTPGHEAFTSMRARGAKVTDIAILVVAADEGIKTQTIEAYNHAKEAGVPVIVAINKMDKEGANPERVKGDLMALGLVSEDYGGDTMMVLTSAKTGVGMDDLLDSILLQSEVMDLKANPNRLAIATVVESHLDKAMGPVATIVINTGTLNIGDSMFAGPIVGKVRTMQDSFGKRIRKVPPSGAVQITGFEAAPMAGDIIQVVENDKIAHIKAEKVAELNQGKQDSRAGLGMSEILSRIQSGKMNFLKVVLKADAQGSIEAIKQMFSKIDNTEVGVKVIHSGVGGITESDIMMAAASQGIVIGFHVAMPPHVRASSEKEHVEVQIYSIIYNLIDDVKKILTGMLVAEEIEIETGRAEVKAVFMTTKKKQIVGAKVVSGVLVNSGDITVYRKDIVIHKTKISNLRSFDKNVEEIKADNECGIQFAEPFEYLEGDILVCVKKEKKMKTL